MAEPLIYQKLTAVMKEIGAIGKGQQAPSVIGGYAFRGIDDVYNALQPALTAHGVIVTPNVRQFHQEVFGPPEKAQMLVTVEVEYTFWAEDGSNLSACVLGQGADKNDKASNKAMSSAFKVAIFQALCVPTQEGSDSERDDVGNLGPSQGRRSSKPAEIPTQKTITKAQNGKLFAVMRAKCKDIDIPAEDGEHRIMTACEKMGFTDDEGVPSTMLITKPHFDAILAKIEAWTPETFLAAPPADAPEPEVF